MKKIKENIFARFKGMTVKSYIQEMMTFVKTNLKKSFVILTLLSLLLILLGVQMSVESMRSEGYDASSINNLSFGKLYFESIQTIAIIVISGIVPYMYISAIGTIVGTLSELTTIAYLIVKLGYVKGFLIGIIPLIISICIMCMAASLGMYICKTVTVNYKISNMKNMNFTNFKLQLYEITKKENKKKALEAKKNKKLELLEKRKSKLDYLQIFNVIVLLFVLEVISSILRVIII